MSNYQVKDNHIAAEYDVNGNVITQDEVNERVKSEIKWLKENGTALSPEQVTNLAKVPVLESQLDDIAMDSPVQNDYSEKPIVSFMWDDGYSCDKTYLKDVFVSEGVPNNICVMTRDIDRIGEKYITKDIIKELYDLGWGIEAHTINHVYSANTSVEQLEIEYRDCAKIIQGITGEYPTAMVYPYGSVNDNAIRMAKKYYKCAIDITGEPNAMPLNQFRIARRDCIGERDGAVTLEECKGYVDECLANKTWLVFKGHTGYDSWVANHTQYSELVRQLIQYIKSKGIEICTIKRGLSLKGNLVDAFSPTDGTFFKVGRNGKVVQSKLPNAEFNTLDVGSNSNKYCKIAEVTLRDGFDNLGFFLDYHMINGNTGVTGKIVFSVRNDNNLSTAPKYIRLINNVIENDPNQSVKFYGVLVDNNGLQKIEIYCQVSSNYRFIHFSKPSYINLLERKGSILFFDEQPWITSLPSGTVYNENKIIATTYYTLNTDSTLISKTTPITQYPVGVSVYPLFSADCTSTGFTDIVGGDLTTYRNYKNGTDVLSYQILREYSSNKVLRRSWNNSSSIWNEFTRIDVDVAIPSSKVIQKRVSAVTFTSINANDEAYVDITVDGINVNWMVQIAPAGFHNKLVFSGYCYKDNTVRVKAFNIGTTAQSNVSVDIFYRCTLA